MGFPFPSTIPDWLSWVFCRFMANGVQLPGEPRLNFLPPLTAVDNPTNPNGASTDVGLGSSSIGVACGGTPLTASGNGTATNIIPPGNGGYAIDTSLGDVQIVLPPPADRQTINFIIVNAAAMPNPKDAIFISSSGQNTILSAANQGTWNGAANNPFKANGPGTQVPFSGISAANGGQGGWFTP